MSSHNTYPGLGPNDQVSLSNKLAGMQLSIEQLQSYVREQDKQIAQCIKHDKSTATLLVKLQRDYCDLSKYTESLEEYCLELDVNIRKRHIILTGVPETVAENRSNKPQLDSDGNEMDVEETNFNPTHAAAFSMLQSIHETLVYDDIDLAYRVGKKGPSPRPIIVKFIRESTRNEVNRNRFHFKDSDESNTVFSVTP